MRPNRIKCANNLKQMGLALHNYHDTNASFPVIDNNPVAVKDWNLVNNGNPGGWQKYFDLSWQTRVFPFLEQDNVWRQTQVAEDGSAFPGDTGNWIPYQYYPWDNSRYLGFGAAQPM